MITSDQVLAASKRLGFDIISGDFYDGTGCCPLSLMYIERTGRVPNCLGFASEVCGYWGLLETKSFYVGFDYDYDSSVCSGPWSDRGRLIKKELDAHIRKN